MGARGGFLGFYGVLWTTISGGDLYGFTVLGAHRLELIQQTFLDTLTPAVGADELSDREVGVFFPVDHFFLLQISAIFSIPREPK